jgi:hypothetical protein
MTENMRESHGPPLDEAREAFFEAESETKDRNRQRDLYMYASKCFYEAASISEKTNDETITESLISLAMACLRRADAANNYGLLRSSVPTNEPTESQDTRHAGTMPQFGRVPIIVSSFNDRSSRIEELSALRALDQSSIRISSQSINSVSSKCSLTQHS